ncbi:MAG: ABC transporter substrate-binding protein [Patescibacteria group bacterium]
MNDIPQSNPKKEFHIKGGEKILSILHSFSATEKVIFSFLILIALVSALIMAWEVNRMFLVPIPAHGGSLTEGIVGLPRSINPVLAFSDADRDLSTLIYSGLMKYNHGVLVNDLAEKYSISEDGLVYTFILKDNIYFHDGKPLTTDDIEFTIQKIQDSVLKSPKRADWANVIIKKISPSEIQFILKQPYSPFLSNTTIGILPKHIWKNVDADQFIFSQYNIEPIGSGPYKLKDIKRDAGGIPQSYDLVSFNKYYDNEAYISSFTIFFYPNEKDLIEAFNNGKVESIASISPPEAVKIASSTNARILDTPLPRIFGVFFNQNNAPVLANKEVRQALNMSIDKKKIVEKVLLGYGISMDSPIPIGIIENATSTPSNKDRAKELLAKSGWLINKDGILEKKDKKSTQILEFSITTADSPDLKQVAEIVKSEWESIGAKVAIKIFEYGDLSQNIIKTRKYDSLLFGEFIGKDLDLYAFWHSSQRNSPGLNVSMYVNSKADKLLEDARAASDENTKKNIYESFNKIIQDEVPAVFLYSPEYMYIVPKKVQGFQFGPISTPSDRFYNLNKWYIATDNVWQIFVNNK